MFAKLRNLFKKSSRKELALDQCYDALEKIDPSDPEYDAVTSQIHKLESDPKKSGVSKDTIATLAVYAGLFVLTIVIEMFGHSITTRALSAVPFKPRLH